MRTGKKKSVAQPNTARYVWSRAVSLYKKVLACSVVTVTSFGPGACSLSSSVRTPCMSATCCSVSSVAGATPVESRACLALARRSTYARRLAASCCGFARSEMGSGSGMASGSLSAFLRSCFFFSPL